MLAVSALHHTDSSSEYFESFVKSPNLLLYKR